MPGMFETSPTGRFEHSEPEIQSIKIPKGVSEFQDALAKLIDLVDRNTVSLGIPKHLIVMDLTQSNSDYAKLEKRLMDEREREAEINKRMRWMRLMYGDRA